MINLTPRQVQILRFIRVYRKERGCPPNYTELMAAMGIGSKGQMSHLMHGLEQRGAIKRNSKRARDYEIVEETAVTLSPEICQLVDAYAEEQQIARETAANELLRGALGAA